MPQKSSQGRSILEEICRKYAVDALYLFGSRSEEIRNWLDREPGISIQSSSDIDVGIKVKTDERWPIERKISLTIDLEDHFACKRIDLILLNEADPFLAAEIVRGERVYARNEDEADEFDLYVLRRAGDLAPLEKERMELILGEGL
jgi:predicted nucleotidyltransferase